MTEKIDILQNLRQSIHRQIVGKDQVIDYILTSLLAGGHILIEDIPGVGKTSLASALAESIDASFQRIQFTSDLLPSDIVGVPIYNSEKHAFEFHPGPIFSNIVLADEINRTTPKTQSALLEAMQEYQVTVDRNTYELTRPFMVIATQNPMEQHGTYALPESQLDRFLFKISVGYPSFEEELKIASEKGLSYERKYFEPVCNTADIVAMQKASTEVRMDESLREYLVRLVHRTRESPQIALGVSPRATISMFRACQSYAFVMGRDYVIPDDIKKIAVASFSHRIVLAAQELHSSDATNLSFHQENAIRTVLEEVEVPM